MEELYHADRIEAETQALWQQTRAFEVQADPSRDGRFLAFLSSEGGAEGLWVQALAGGPARLLLRHGELQRTNTLLHEQIEQLTRERDNLKSRLGAARNRIDALLDRLPQEASAKESE